MSVVNIAVGVAGIVVGVIQYSDASKKQDKRDMQGIAIGSLSSADQKALNDKILRVNTQTERLRILAEATASVHAAEAVQASKNTNTTFILLLGAGGLLITAAFLIKKA